MDSKNIGIFHDTSAEVLSLLGKKGTESDIIFSNRKEGDTLYAFLEPRNDKLSAKSQIMQTADIPVIVIDEITPSLGETILMLDALKKKNGIIIVSDYVDRGMFERISKDTVVSAYKETKKDFSEIMGAINGFDIKRNNDDKTVIEVDHFFNVKGLGTVILGFVKQGTAKKYSKLKMLPQDKEVTVRSIQMHDKDFDEAGAGCRVGLAIKGADADEFTRGTLLCEEGSAEVKTEFDIEFSKNKFYSDEITTGKKFHISLGMQFFLVTVKELNENNITLEAEKKSAISHKKRALLIDLNVPKLHLAGFGTTL